MNNQFDLFSILGVEPTDIKKSNTSSENSSKKSKDTNKKQEKKNEIKSSETYVMLPITVNSVYLEPIVFTAEDFKDIKKVTAKMVHEQFALAYPEFTLSLSSNVYDAKNNSLFVYHKGAYAQSKVTINANAKTKFLMAGIDFDLATLMTNDECVIDSQDIIKYYQDTYPEQGSISLLYSATQNIIVPYFNEDEFPTEGVSLPVTVKIFGRGERVFTKKDCIKYLKLEENNNEDVSKDDVSMVEEDVLEGMLAAVYQDMKGLIKLLYNKETNTVVVKAKEPLLAAKPSEKTYPTNATISIYIHTSILLNPDMFKGHSEITEKELVSFIQSRYPEFSPERTKIIFDKEKNLIIPTLISSSKGCLPIVETDFEEKQFLENNNLFIRKYGKQLYRLEKNPISLTKACMEGAGEYSQYTYFLPKIPIKHLKEAEEFFQRYYNISGAEVMLQLFYKPIEKQYYWYLPIQTVSAGDVYAERNSDIEMRDYLIADFHSHGKFDTFWSLTDTLDEKGSRIYGVMGNFHRDHKNYHSLLLRAGTGGYFVDIKVDDCFDMTVDGLDDDVVTTLLNDASRRIIVRRG